MSTNKAHQHISVKVYHGFGHKHNLTLYGHVYKNRFARERNYHTNIIANIIYLVKLFCIKPVNGAKVQLVWNRQVIPGITEEDGFYKFEWESEDEVPAG